MSTEKYGDCAIMLHIIVRCLVSGINSAQGCINESSRHRRDLLWICAACEIHTYTYKREERASMRIMDDDKNPIERNKCKNNFSISDVNAYRKAISFCASFYAVYSYYDFVLSCCIVRYIVIQLPPLRASCIVSTRFSRASCQSDFCDNSHSVRRARSL